MQKRTSYYTDLYADYSAPGLVTSGQQAHLLALLERIHHFAEPALPSVGTGYPLEQIEAENKEWFPTHAEALRQGRFDLLEHEYREDFAYLCADGPFRGKGAASEREANWVALIAQPGVTMCWPIVQFSGEAVYFEWVCRDDVTHENVAKGNVTFLRRGHRGGIHLKTEQLTFYRDVSAAPGLLKLIQT
ncbi:MAG: hypothetical protein PHC88_01770 [Terrimicrobiaceae bacterium]|nr:hypothetical protein [Terrimicrobiaceae bacterium]